MGNADFFNTKILEKALNAASLRQQVIASNIANVNVAGYKPQNVAFESELKKAIAGEESGFQTASLEMKNGYIPLETEGTVNDVKPIVYQDGAKVDINKEMVNQAKNTIIYNALIAKISKNISMLKYVIDNTGR